MSIKRQSIIIGLFILISFNIVQYIIYLDKQSIKTHIDKIEKIVKEDSSLSKKGELKEHIDSISGDLKSNKILYTVLVANILINLILYLFSSKIVNNLTKVKNGLDQFFRYIKQESDEVAYIKVDSKDEFYDISREINNNIKLIEDNLKRDRDSVDEVVSITSKLIEGDFSSRISTNPSNPQIVILKENINNFLKNMHKNLNQIVDVLDAYKSKDYRQKINIDARGELKDLKDGVNHLGDELMAVEERIKNSLNQKSNKLLKMANLLNKNMTHLSESIKKESQNSKEIYKKIEDINDKVLQTVKSSESMKNNAKESREMAQNGKELAQKTMNAIESIHNSTQNIDESISKIDEIAFQTNILSLNAAVEAATAGEAGKGFAVVAGEVRNLASKSSEVAKDIKALIEDTKNRSLNGIEISKEMMDGFLNLNSKTNDTYTIVEEVSSDAKNEENMLKMISSLMEELKLLSDKNSKVVEDTNNLSKEILSISNDLKEEVGEESIKVEA